MPDYEPELGQMLFSNTPYTNTETPGFGTRVESVLAMVAPIVDAGKGKIGTHSDRCYEHHAGCLAARVHRILTGGDTK